MASVFSSLAPKIGPVGQLTMKHGGGGISRFRNKDVVQSAPAGTNPENIDNWGFDNYCIFPNFQVSAFGGFWHYHYFQPHSPNRMIWEHRIFFPKAQTAGTRFAQEFSRSIQEIVAEEDGAVSERNQEGLESGAFEALALHDQELRIRHTRKALADFMQS
jgi:phenylpropionate dioxygenase-like ring-hydroxylating dioxygenase large terminal subunit